MTIFELAFLLQVVFNQVTLNKVVTMGTQTQDLSATACSTTADAAWTDHDIPTGFYTPFDVAATDTQSGDGCAQSSKLQPSVSLP